jgi:hypothetical protein
MGTAVEALQNHTRDPVPSAKRVKGWPLVVVIARQESRTQGSIGAREDLDSRAFRVTSRDRQELKRRFGVTDDSAVI